jgi:hypothetical protein
MSIIETLRTPRLSGFVVFDYAATIIGAASIAYYNNINFVITLIILLILSIILHVIFNINTKTNKLFGLN